LSITYPAINAARQVTFIVSGAAKSSVLQRVLQEPPTDELPASLVNPTSGELLWLVDRAAGSLL
jgi:6-phosphogluconolactonase